MLHHTYAFEDDILPHNIKSQIVIIGNFDGVHRGHQHLIDQARLVAKDKKIITVTFNPHPKAVFARNIKHYYLSNRQQKLQRLYDHHVDAVVEIAFDKEFAKKTAEEFIISLIDKLQPRHIVVGKGFTFGYQKKGDINLLQLREEQGGYQAHEIEKLILSDQKQPHICSSTLIRHYLAEGKIEEANQALGYSWTVNGSVVHGEKRGRKIGFPTLNLYVEHYQLLKFGVYAVMIDIQHKSYQGVANFGCRPTFGKRNPLLEVHIFDFQEDIYEQEVSVTFLHWIRPEKTFESVEKLIQQIREDCNRAKDQLSILCNQI